MAGGVSLLFKNDTQLETQTMSMFKVCAVLNFSDIGILTM